MCERNSPHTLLDDNAQSCDNTANNSGLPYQPTKTALFNRKVHSTNSRRFYVQSLLICRTVGVGHFADPPLQWCAHFLCVHVCGSVHKHYQQYLCTCVCGFADAVSIAAFEITPRAPVSGWCHPLGPDPCTHTLSAHTQRKHRCEQLCRPNIGSVHTSLDARTHHRLHEYRSSSNHGALAKATTQHYQYILQYAFTQITRSRFQLGCPPRSIGHRGVNSHALIGAFRHSRLQASASTM